MTWPSNFQHTIAIETAISMNLQPTMMLFKDKQPTDLWTEADKKLAMAWVILKRETCKKCGQPLWICRSSNKNLSFSVQKDKCYATAAFEKWQESKTGGKAAKPGDVPYIVAKMYKDEPLPSRLDYYREQNDE